MPDVVDTTLDVFLRQGRPYVQGTQIVARIGDMLPTGTRLKRVQFNAITDHVVRVSQSKPEAELLGTIQVQAEESRSDLYFSATDHVAPGRDTPMPISVSRDGGSDSEARYQFSGATGFEDFLNVIVQSVKAEHEFRFAGAYDVWFTGLRGADVANTIAIAPGTGHVDMTLFRHMGQEGQYQTIWNLAVRPAGADDTISAAITFAYKTKDA